MKKLFVIFILILSVSSSGLELLKVPQIRQSIWYYCGVSSTEAIIVYYHLNDKEYETFTEFDLAEELKPIEGIGTDYKNILISLKKRNMGVEYFDSTTEKTPLEKLKKALKEGKPVIIEIQAWDDKGTNYTDNWDHGHYVVAIGYDEKNIYLMDPWVYGNYAYIPLKEFPSRWHGDDGTKKAVHISNMGIIVWNNSKPEYKPDTFVYSE